MARGADAGLDGTAASGSASGQRRAAGWGRAQPGTCGSAAPDILVVDDEREIAELVGISFAREGLSARVALDGASALGQLKDKVPDAAVLDVMLPDMDGFELLRQIRAHGGLFPIVMLTARVGDEDKIRGLASGADDYVTKPFNPRELAARVKSQLRRSREYDQRPAEEAAELEAAGLVVNNDLHRAWLYGRRIDLTRTEFAILWYLLQNRSRAVPVEELYEAVWGEGYLEGSSSTVMAHIARLRAKLGESARRQRVVQTVWGVGYTIE